VPLNGGPLALWSAAKNWPRYLRIIPVDVFHAHYRRSVHVGRMLQRARPGIPLLYTLHLSHIADPLALAAIAERLRGPRPRRQPAGTTLAGRRRGI